MSDEDTSGDSGLTVNPYKILLDSEPLPKFSNLSSANVNQAAQLLSALSVKFEKLKDDNTKVDVTKEKLDDVNKSVFGLFVGSELNGGRRRTRSARRGKRRAKSRRRRYY